MGSTLDLPLPAQRRAQRSAFRGALEQMRGRKAPIAATEASRRRSQLVTSILLSSYDPEAVVAWRSSLAPSEMFFALGVVPFFIESVSSVLSSAQAYYDPLDVSAARHYSKDCCTFMRTVVGSMELDLLPTPDFLVGMNFYCDVEPKVADVAASHYGKPHFLIEIPSGGDERERIEYLAGQIERTMRAMAESMGRPVDMDQLARVIERSNRARAHFLEAMRLRRSIPSPIRGREMIDNAAIIANTWGTEGIVEIYRQLADEIRERVRQGMPAVEGERFRILWRHLRPYFDDEVFDYLELEKKAVVVYEEINHVYWDEMDPADPFRSLARKVLSNPSIGPMRRWVEKTVQVAKEFRIDGIIAVNQWGCRYLDSPSQYTKTVLRSEGIPALVLDLDLIDRRNYSEGQARTRIDAFVELLENRG